MEKVLKKLRKKLVMYCHCCRGHTEHHRIGLTGGWKCSLCGNKVW